MLRARMVIRLVVSGLSVAAVVSTAISRPQSAPRSQISVPPGSTIAMAAHVETQAIAATVSSGGVPIRAGEPNDGSLNCPVEKLQVLWSAPPGNYSHGAHIEPLGPAPTADVTSANGVVVCAGSHYAYMGFEAIRSGSGWDVVPVPDIDHEGEANAEILQEEKIPAPVTPHDPVAPGAARPSAGLRSPASGTKSTDIERYAPYTPQSTCSPGAKKGVLAFRDMLLATYPASRNLGIGRGCSIGGRSEHKEGRAFDWGIRADRPSERAQAERVLSWLFATDAAGNTHANARRLGVMYIVWNRQIWGAYRADAGWRAYSGSSPHTDHIHFSFAWEGARKTTSYWTGKAAGMAGGGSGAGVTHVSDKSHEHGGAQSSSGRVGSASGRTRPPGATHDSEKFDAEKWRAEWRERMRERTETHTGRTPRPPRTPDPKHPVVAEPTPEAEPEVTPDPTQAPVVPKVAPSVETTRRAWTGGRERERQRERERRRSIEERAETWRDRAADTRRHRPRPTWTRRAGGSWTPRPTSGADALG